MQQAEGGRAEATRRTVVRGGDADCSSRREIITCPKTVPAGETRVCKDKGMGKDKDKGKGESKGMGPITLTRAKKCTELKFVPISAIPTYVSTVPTKRTR